MPTLPTVNMNTKAFPQTGKQWTFVVNKNQSGVKIHFQIVQTYSILQEGSHKGTQS